MTDEAHRAQYSLLAANLDRAIPNATLIGLLEHQQVKQKRNTKTTLISTLCVRQ